MELSGIMEPLKKSLKFKRILKGLKNEEVPVGVYGIADSGKSYLINTLFEEDNKSILVITNNDLEAKNLYEDLSFFNSNTYYFPTKELVFYNIYALSGDLRWERLKVINEMLKKDKKIIVASVESLMSVYTPIELFYQYIFTISMEDCIDIKYLEEKFIQCGYERVDIVEGKGEFSVRGGILDVYPPISSVAYRLEFFGDEIDSIRSFNTESQRSIEKVNQIQIFPAKELILNKDIVEKGYEAIKEDFEKTISNFKNEKSRIKDIKNLRTMVNNNLESLKETWNFENIENYMCYFYEKLSTFLDYNKDSYIILDEWNRTLGKIDSLYFEFEENYKNFYERLGVLKRHWQLLLPKDQTVDLIKENTTVILNALDKINEDYVKKEIEFSEKTINNYQGQLDLLIDDIKKKKNKKYKILILSGTKSRGERLVNILRDRNIESVYKDFIEVIQEGEVVITSGSLLKGFDFSDIKLYVISDKEVFGESKRNIKKNKNKAKGISKIKSFSELKLGDYVVHANHGIGIYKGIKQLEVQGHKKDYLDIEYNGGDKLYVPVEQLDLVQKYVGSEGKSPRVNKLGSVEWTKTKNKVKKSINEIAEDLVKLYAIRNTLRGHRFSKDTPWQKQFEEEFPYEETEDQIIAIQEIKEDMESNKPMDRLLCGDVGYGKTEVAVRAAFKAMMDGKQVAVLVPTTILAEQHYNNFIKRFSGFPIKVDMISRFRTPSQQKESLKKLKEGNVDILIGTHRILQKDVKFKDLGLLIVDEEQRFGVSHKEKIKNLKKNIDVLTLTATPIPRTLHMSLTGVRDISVIETPPENRYPVQTYVVEFNEQLIRDAIIREINREGQVYFVYNRVNTIRDMEAYISKLVPEAKVGIIHGQMTERELENVLVDFLGNKINVLICTTIIETGIDIQNVNTMIIYDADKMGLSQLYQLRGRVGRTNKIAYAYFTYKKDKVLTEIAEKRLKAIKDFTELGSGFKIAMRDLEIRGAGNMMGEAQHGHMAAVGYDLYCRMLEETVKKVKGEELKEDIETDIKINIDAYIPDKYIPDEVQKIEIYKKIASIDSYDAMMEVREEIEDRYSNLPESVENLIKISYIRVLSSLLKIDKIQEMQKEIEFEFSNKDFLKEEIVKGLLDKYNKKIIFKFGDIPKIGYKTKDVKKNKILDILKGILEDMISFVEKV